MRQKALYKKTLPLAVFLSLVLAVSANAQITVDDVYTIPSKFSANQPVLLVAKTSALQDPAYVSWDIVTDPHLGSFSKVSPEKWFCFFSNENSNCGPVPFDQGGAGVRYDVEITAFSGKETSSVKTFSVSPSELGLAKITDQGIPGGTSWLIVIAPQNAIINGTPTFKIYRAADLSEADNGNLERIPDSGYYRFNYTFTEGKYYVSFEFNSDKGQGGFVKYLDLGEAVATGNLNADPAKDQAASNFGGTYTKDYSIRNPLSQPFDNLTIVVPDEIKDIVKIIPSKLIILSKETIKYTLKIENIKSSLFINSFFELHSGIGTAKRLLNKIPIQIKIDLAGSSPGSGGPNLLIVDPVWTGEYLLTENITKDIVLRNTGTGELSINSIDPKDDLDNINIPYSVSPEKISSSDGKITLSIKPTSMGTYSGKITLSSNGGSSDVAVNIKVFDDLENQVSTLKNSIPAKKEDMKKKYSAETVEELFKSINLNIQKADNSVTTKQYSEAEQSLEKVRAQLEMLDKLPAPPQGINPLFLVIILVVVGVVIFILKKKPFSKKKKVEEPSEYPEDDEYTEEEPAA